MFKRKKQLVDAEVVEFTNIFGRRHIILSYGGRHATVEARGTEKRGDVLQVPLSLFQSGL